MWIKLEKVIPCKRNQTQTPRIIKIYLHEMSRTGKSMETIRRLVIA